MTKDTLLRLGLGAVAMLWTGAACYEAGDEGFKAMSFAQALVAIGAWGWGEIEYTNSKRGTAQLSNAAPTDNDIRVARQLWRMHSRTLRSILKDSDLWSFTPVEDYDRLTEIWDQGERGELFFNDTEFDKKLSSFISAVHHLIDKVGADRVPVKIGGRWVKGYKPESFVPDERYERLRKESKVANNLATSAWMLLDSLVTELKTRMPAAFSEPLN